MLDDDGEEETGEATPRKDGGDEEGESLLRRLKRWESLARNHWSAWRDEAKQCYDFVAGHQWTSDDKAALLDQMRQPVTFNRVAPMVDAVTGAEILNRQEVRYQGDVQVNELITAADEWAREQADTEDEELDAFADVVICGMGWSETRMDYAEDPEGRIVDDRIDPLEMWSDPAAKKRCIADARFIVRARWRDKGDLPKAWKRKLAATTEGNAGSIDEVQSGCTGPKDDYDRDEEPGANPVPGDMLELAKKAGVPEPKIKGLTQAIAPEAERVAAQGWREFADVPTDLTGVVKLAAKRLAEAADARNAEQLRQLMTQTDPRVLYMALQEMQRMSPGIRDLEQLWKMAGMGASAVTGQVRNQDYEPDPDRYYLSIRERRPRPINE